MYSNETDALSSAKKAEPAPKWQYQQQQYQHVNVKNWTTYTHIHITNVYIWQQRAIVCGIYSYT